MQANSQGTLADLKPRALLYDDDRKAYGFELEGIEATGEPPTRAPFVQRHFQLFHKQALAAHLAERPVQDLIALGGHAQQLHRVAARLQTGAQGLQRRAGLDHRHRAGGRAEVRQIDRLLHVEPPVDQPDNGLDVEQDDRRPARATEHVAESAVAACEHNGRVHCASRPFAALDTIGHRAALLVGGKEGEIGELIV